MENQNQQNSYHIHNGIDQPNIDPQDLLGFRIDNVATATTAPTDSARNGTIRFQQDGVNYVMWVRISNLWKKATLS